MPLLIFAWKASLWDKEKATGSSPIEIKEQKDLQHLMKRRNMKVTCTCRTLNTEKYVWKVNYFSFLLQHTLQVGSRQTKTSGTSYYKHLFVSCLVKYMHQYYRRVSYPLLNEGIVRDALWEDLEGEKRRSRALHKIGGRGVGVGGLGGRRGSSARQSGGNAGQMFQIHHPHTESCCRN